MWFSVVPALPAEPQPPPILCWIIEKSLKKQKYINNKHLASVKVFHSRWLNPPWDSRGTTTMCKLRVTFAWTFKSMETRQKHNVKQKTDKHKLRLYHQRVVQKLRFFFLFLMRSQSVGGARWSSSPIWGLMKADRMEMGFLKELAEGGFFSFRCLMSAQRLQLRGETHHSDILLHQVELNHETQNFLSSLFTGKLFRKQRPDCTVI